MKKPIKIEPKFVMEDMLIAVEFGYKAAEKGMNIQMAIKKFRQEFKP